MNIKKNIKNSLILITLLISSPLYSMHLRRAANQHTPINLRAQHTPRILMRYYSDSPAWRLKKLKIEAAECLAYEKALQHQKEHVSQKIDECLVYGCTSGTIKCSKKALCIDRSRQLHAAWKVAQKDTVMREREIEALELVLKKY